MRRISKYLLLTGLFLAATLHGALPKITVTDRCNIAAGEITFRVALRDSKGAFHFLNSDAFYQQSFEKNAGSSALKANIELPGDVTGSFQQDTLTAANGDFDYKAKFTFPKPVKVRRILLAPLAMPVKQFAGRTLQIDGKPFTLPEEKGKVVIFEKAGIKTVEIPLKTGVLVITGNIDLYIQDQRANGPKNYSMHIRFNPSIGDAVTSSELNLSMKIRE